MIELINLNKIYAMKNRTVQALRQVTLRIGQGEFVSIVGRSGSGKTTLMNIMGCLDTPTSGKYLLDGKPVEWIGNRQMAQVRNRKIGFVFQDFHLISSLSAEENVELPLLFRGVDKKSRREEAMKALGKVGLEDRAAHRPRQLSGGQRQRVAIARAVAGDPAIILADEPTGNLDVPSGIEIMDMLSAIHGMGKTVVLITHDMSVATRAQRTLHMEDGRLWE